jgi:hypothetical protein
MMLDAMLTVAVGANLEFLREGRRSQIQASRSNLVN